MADRTPAEIEDLLGYLSPEERAEFNALVAADKARVPWRPLPGPQMDVLRSPADIIGYGGAAGGGKTDLICGLVLTEHQRAVVFRKEKAQTERIVQRLEELLGSQTGFNSQKGIWKLPTADRRRLLELGGLDNPGDEHRWQGRDHDLKAYDEVTEMREAQVRYTIGWKRSPDASQRCRVLMTFNPPTTAEGRWIIRFFAPWLEEHHPNPAKPGELRWFASVGDNPDYEVEGPAPFVVVDDAPCYEFDQAAHSPEQIVQPESRTFIPSRVVDNPYYMKSGYIATLQGLPEPLRSQMLHGDFNAGLEDDMWQVIPTGWVKAAQSRWQKRDDKGPMDSIGSDPARGGRDKHVIARRHGTWFDELLRFDGTQTPDGPAVAAQIIAARRNQAPVHIDMIGWGSSPYDFLRQNGIQVVGINGAAKSAHATQTGELRFANLRAEVWWRMREALDPDAPHPLALPPDAKLLADLCAPRWKVTAGGILIEDKEQLKKRLGRSPDDGDAVCLANISTLKIADRPGRRPPRALSDHDPYHSTRERPGARRDYDPYD